jgi:hypothetical protein
VDESDVLQEFHQLNVEAKKFLETLKQAGHVQTLMANTASMHGGVFSSAVGGQLGLMNGQTQMMPTSLAIPALASAKMGMYSNVLSSAFRTVGGISAGALAAMPDYQKTMDYSTNYYGAALSAGNINRGGLESATFSRMNGGITSPGSAAMSAAILGNSGISMTNGLGGSLYNNTVSSIRNAARYMNVDNLQAAASFSNLYSGQISSNLMQNFGIYTGDVKTGRTYTQSEIFSQLAARMGPYAATATVDDINASYRAGGLGVTLRNSGLDDTQQQMFLQYLRNKAQGKGSTDLSSNSSMENVYSGQTGNKNPLEAQYSINSSQERTMGQAEGNYIGGTQGAAKAVDALEAAAGQAAQSVLGFSKALTTAIGSSQSGAGAAAAGAAATGGALDIGGSILQYAALRGMMSKMTGASPAALEAGVANSGMVSKLARFGSKVGRAGGLGLVGAIGGQLAGAGVKAAGGSDQWASAANGALSGAGTGAMIGTFFDPVTFGTGTLVGAGIGAVAGGLMGYFGGGGTKNSVATGGTTDTTKSVSFIAPVNGPVTTKYGQTTDAHGVALWGGRPHNAIDFGVDHATVVASAAGTVKEASTGSGKFSYGNYIIIDHGQGYTTLYAHLDSFMVKVGDSVKQGQPIAISGATGYVTGPHLHFELRKNGVSVDPSGLLGGNFAISGGAASIGSSAAVGIGLSSSLVTTDATGMHPSSQSSTQQVPVAYSGATLGGSSGTAKIGIGKSGSTYSSGGNKTTDAAGGSPANSINANGMLESVAGNKGGNNVTVHLNIQQATESEARKFAQLIKSYLEDDALTENMGRF